MLALLVDSWISGWRLSVTEWIVSGPVVGHGILEKHRYADSVSSAVYTPPLCALTIRSGLATSKGGDDNYHEESTFLGYDNDNSGWTAQQNLRL